MRRREEERRREEDTGGGGTEVCFCAPDTTCLSTPSSFYPFLEVEEDKDSKGVCPLNTVTSQRGGLFVVYLFVCQQQRGLLLKAPVR